LEPLENCSESYDAVCRFSGSDCKYGTGLDSKFIKLDKIKISELVEKNELERDETECNTMAK
jgi:hypothetical protein